MKAKIFSVCRWCALAILPGALFLLPTEAKAQFTVYDPVTAANTWMTYVQQAMTYEREVQQVLTAIQHLQLAIREAQQLVTHPSTNILADLSQIGNVIQSTQGLALNLAQVDATFQSQLNPFQPSPVVGYAAQYNTWANTALQALHASANASGFQGNLMLGNEQQFMQQMQTLIQQPNGQDQALQIGHALAFEQLAQMQKLRTLIASDATARAAAMTTQINMEQTSQQAAATQFSPAVLSSDGSVW